MSRIDPIDQDLLDFLCACVHHRCNVRTIKAPRKAALRRLRYAGLVNFDNFQPSGSALRDWSRRNIPPSLDRPEGSAGETPPVAKAAEDGGAAIARDDGEHAVVDAAAPPRPTGSQLYARMMAEAAARGLKQTHASLQAFGNPVQMSNMKSSREPVRPGTLDKALAWLASEPDIHGASGTARKASGAEESTSASSVTDGAPSAFPKCGHPRTPDNSQKVGANRGPVCATCRNEKAREARKARPALSPFDPAAAPDKAEKVRRANARRGNAVRKAANRRAMERIEQGLPISLASGAQVKCAQQMLEGQLREAARLADPIEQAKRVLQRRYAPVCSMAVYGGDADRYVVGNRKNVSQAELLQMAERMAA